MQIKLLLSWNRSIIPSSVSISVWRCFESFEIGSPKLLEDNSSLPFITLSIFHLIFLLTWLIHTYWRCTYSWLNVMTSLSSLPFIASSQPSSSLILPSGYHHLCTSPDPMWAKLVSSNQQLIWPQCYYNPTSSSIYHNMAKQERKRSWLLATKASLAVKPALTRLWKANFFKRLFLETIYPCWDFNLVLS